MLDFTFQVWKAENKQKPFYCWQASNGNKRSFSPYPWSQECLLSFQPMPAMLHQGKEQALPVLNRNANNLYEEAATPSHI